MSHLLTIIGCNGKSLRVANCIRWRADGCAARCTKFGTLSQDQCSTCAIRIPVMRSEPASLRGLGDLVHRLIRILFLGRLDIAERLAGRVEALWEARRRKAPVSLPVAQSRPCGCKARQQRLNDLLPFGK